jgi:hypothetical protein
VFYTFTLAAPELVYADTFGSATDTILFLQDSAGANVTAAGTTGGATCNDDHGSGCSGFGGGLDSRIVARLNAGRYFLVLKSCRTSMDAVSLRFQHLPVGNNTTAQITPSSTAASVAGTTTGTGLLTAPESCFVGSSRTQSPENTYWFVTCPNDPMQLLHASTCGAGRTLDTLVYQRSATSTAVACDDDQGFDCSLGSSITSNIPAGAGLHTVVVDGYNGGTGGFTLNYRATACLAGFTNCSGTCRETTRFQTDNNNCGACGTVCSAGNDCQAGACRPANNNRSSAISVALGTAEVTRTGTTANATADGPTDCGGAIENVWYTFTLAEQRIVYADTAGSSYDTRLSFVNSAGTTVAGTCNDDAFCTGAGFTAGNQSRSAAVLAAGTWFVNVSGYVAGRTGAFTLHLQSIRADAVGYLYTDPLTATTTTSNTFLTTTNRATPTCGGGLGPSGEDGRWFLSCGTASHLLSLCPSDGGTWTRASGTTIYDAVMYVRAGLTGAEAACNDDGGTGCAGTGGDTSNYGSRISQVFPRGLNLIFIDERLRTGGMHYSLRYTQP